MTVALSLKTNQLLIALLIALLLSPVLSHAFSQGFSVASLAASVPSPKALSVAIDENCNCTVDQVQSNSVAACDLTIGTIDTVSTVSELWTAINLANSSGGNRTILIEDGVYPVASTSAFPYITGDNIVFRSLSGNRDAVILEGEGMLPGAFTENGFLIAGNNVTIADLTIREVGNHGIQVSGHNLFVHNVRIQDTYEQMIKGSTTAASIDSATIQCSLMEYTAGIGPNFYIGGLDIHKGKDWLVRDNLIRFISSPSASVAEHAIHFWDNSLNNTVERNFIFNCDRGIGFGLGSSGLQNQGGMIRNNMIYNDGLAPFHDVGIGLESSPDTRVYNNTVFVEYPNAIEYRFASTSNVDIVNNLSNQAITSRNGGTASLQTNVSNADASYFVNVNIGDLHLAGCPIDVVDQGTDLSAYFSGDIDQVLRPQGAAFDIGAQEKVLSTIVEDIINETIAFDLYPNPAFTNIHLTVKSEADYQLRVTNCFGILMQQYVGGKGTASLELNLNDWPSGIYIVSMKSKGSVRSSSFIKY